MKSAYLILLLCTLPLLFAVPYMLSVDKAPEAEIAGIEAIVYLAQEKKLMKPDQEKNTGLDMTSLGFHIGKYKDPEQGEDALSYFIYVPEKPWPKDIKFPLVIHFSDIQENTISTSAMYATQGRMPYDFPAIHFVPQLTNGVTWRRDKKSQKSPALGRVMEAVGRIMVENPIDEEKVYAVGCGVGSYGVLGALTRYPGLFAGAIAHSSGWDLKKANILAQTPLLMMTGAENKKISRIITKNLAAVIKEQGGKVAYKEIEGMPHNCDYSGFYSKKVWSWLFSNKNSLLENEEAKEIKDPL